MVKHLVARRIVDLHDLPLRHDLFRQFAHACVWFCRQIGAERNGQPVERRIHRADLAQVECDQRPVDVGNVRIECRIVGVGDSARDIARATAEQGEDAVVERKDPDQVCAGDHVVSVGCHHHCDLNRCHQTCVEEEYIELVTA